MTVLFREQKEHLTITQIKALMFKLNIDYARFWVQTLPLCTKKGKSTGNYHSLQVLTQEEKHTVLSSIVTTFHPGLREDTVERRGRYYYNHMHLYEKT